jgi:hypothetical protein
MTAARMCGESVADVVEQIANSDGFPVGGKFRKEVSQVVVVTQLAIAHQQHNARRCKLLSKRRQPEIRSIIDGRERPQISNAISASKHRLAVANHKHRRPRGVDRFQRRKNGVDLPGRNLCGYCGR